MHSLEELKEVFEYADGKIYWKISPRYDVHIGAEAGSLDHYGYSETQYEGIRYKIHRLVYFLHTGLWPPIIDHIDQNRNNNRIENLRDIPQLLNCHNSSATWGSTPYRGVSYLKSKKRYRPVFSLMGKRYTMGSFLTAEEASIAYESMRKKVLNELIKENE